MKPKAAVIGDPVAHSLSPGIFETLARELERPLDYQALRVAPAELPAALERARAEGWVGLNVTLPHKVAIVPLLDGLHESARPLGAVNVVRFDGGRRIGYNTDAEGFLAPLARRGTPLQGRRGLVLGTGGAARAVCAALRGAGMEAVVLGRSREKAAALAAELGLRAGGLDSAPAEAVEADLVVNATSAGMDGSSCALPEEARFKRGALAYDLVYRPLRTPFLARAERDGAGTISGLPMLVAQAAATWRIWFDMEVPREMAAKIEIGLAGYLGWSVGLPKEGWADPLAGRKLSWWELVLKAFGGPPISG